MRFYLMELTPHDAQRLLSWESNGPWDFWWPMRNITCYCCLFVERKFSQPKRISNFVILQNQRSIPFSLVAVPYDHLDRSIMHRDDSDNRFRWVTEIHFTCHKNLQKKTNYSMTYSMTLEWAREYLEQLRNIQEQGEARRKMVSRRG